MEQVAKFFLEEGFFEILIKDLKEADRNILTKIYVEKVPEEKLCQKSFDFFGEPLTSRKLRNRRNKAIKKMAERYKHYTGDDAFADAFTD